MLRFCFSSTCSLSSVHLRNECLSFLQTRCGRVALSFRMYQRPCVEWSRRWMTSSTGHCGQERPPPRRQVHLRRSVFRTLSTQRPATHVLWGTVQSERLVQVTVTFSLFNILFIFIIVLLSVVIRHVI